MACDCVSCEGNLPALHAIALRARQTSSYGMHSHCMRGKPSRMTCNHVTMGQTSPHDMRPSYTRGKLARMACNRVARGVKPYRILSNQAVGCSSRRALWHAIHCALCFGAFYPVCAHEKRPPKLGGPSHFDCDLTSPRAGTSGWPQCRKSCRRSGRKSGTRRSRHAQRCF